MILDNIKEVVTDWYYTIEFGEKYYSYRVSDKSVRKIMYNEVDKYCTVYYWDGGSRDVFNINKIIHFNDKEREDMYDKYDNTDITRDKYVENFYR